MIPVNINVSVKENTIHANARRALIDGLYQNPNWMFYELLLRPVPIIRMATAFYNRKRVGISLYWDYDLIPEYKGQAPSRQLGCYVKEEFRRHGIGTQLVNRMRVPEQVLVGQGLSISLAFWNTVKPHAVYE